MEIQSNRIRGLLLNRWQAFALLSLDGPQILFVDGTLVNRGVGVDILKFPKIESYATMHQFKIAYREFFDDQ